MLQYDLRFISDKCFKKKQKKNKSTWLSPLIKCKHLQHFCFETGTVGQNKNFRKLLPDQQSSKSPHLSSIKGVLWWVAYSVNDSSLRVVSSVVVLCHLSTWRAKDEAQRRSSDLILGLCSKSLHSKNTFALRWKLRGHVRSLEHYVRHTLFNFLSSQVPKPTTARSTVCCHLTT